MSHRPLRYALLTLLAAGFVGGGWACSRVSVLLAFALVPIAVLALIMAAKLLSLSAVNRTREEVIAILQSFLDARDSSYDPRWDDFVSVPIQDPELDGVRRRLLQLESSHSRMPPEDFLRAWKRALREALTGSEQPLPNMRLKLTAPVECGRIALVIIPAWRRSLSAIR